MNRSVSKPTHFWYLFFVLLLSGCTIRLVSMYDEVTDTSLTEIQKKTDSFIEKAKANDESQASSFANSKAFYEEIDKDLKSLLFRVGSIPKNKEMESLVRNIQLLIVGDQEAPKGTSLKELHQITPSGGVKVINSTAFALAQRQINQALHAALSLELAKKSRKQ